MEGKLPETQGGGEDTGGVEGSTWAVIGGVGEGQKYSIRESRWSAECNVSVGGGVVG